MIKYKAGVVIRMSVGIKTIASKLGISTATVSLALNGSKVVSERTKKLVEKTARELGYKPNLYARSLVLQKSGMVGVIVPDIENNFYSALVGYLNSFFREKGYTVSIQITANSDEYELSTIEKLISLSPEGMVYVPINKPTDTSRVEKMLRDANIPTVCATTRFSDFPSVMCDMSAGIGKCVDYLCSIGKKRISLVTGNRGLYAFDIREAGFIDAIRRNRLHSAKILCCDDVTYEDGVRAAHIMLENDLYGSDAVICVNDLLATALINTFLSNGIRVPSDVSVCGFDDTVFASVCAVPITSVRQDVKMIAKRASELLCSMIGGEEGKDVIIDTELDVKSSS